MFRFLEVVSELAGNLSEGKNGLQFFRRNVILVKIVPKYGGYGEREYLGQKVPDIGGFQMEDNYERNYGLVILELLHALKDKIALILAATVLAGVMGWVVSATLLPRKYEASVNMIVNTRTEIVGVVTSDSISSAQDLVDTYAIIIKSNKVLNQVIEQLSLKMSYEELSEKISVDPIRNTQVMKIAAQCSDANQALMIVQTISEIAPAIVADAVEAGSCKVVSDVYTTGRPVSPNTLKNIFMGAALAFVLVCAAVILQELFNDYVLDETDLEKKLGLTVIGVIPDVEE